MERETRRSSSRIGEKREGKALLSKPTVFELGHKKSFPRLYELREYLTGSAESIYQFRQSVSVIKRKAKCRYHNKYVSFSETLFC